MHCRGAIILAKTSVVPVRRGYWGNKIGKPHTVPTKATGKCGSVTVSPTQLLLTVAPHLIAACRLHCPLPASARGLSWQCASEATGGGDSAMP